MMIDHRGAFGRTGRAGRPALILALVILIGGAAALVLLAPPQTAAMIATAALALFAAIGVFAAFALSAGLLRVAGREAGGDDLPKRICDENPDGLIATQANGGILYANPAYRAFCASSSLAELRPVERLIGGGSPEASEAVYRLAQAAREGRAHVEETRLKPSAGGAAGWRRIETRPLQFPGAKRATLWTVADITRDRERQEAAFQELRRAIDCLDNAPAGFFSCRGDGTVDYVNATLAAWLDYDLAEIGSGGLTLGAFLSGDAAQRVAALAGAPGEVKTQILDLELKRRGGQTLPVRLIHRVTFDADGAAGPSHSLALDRAGIAERSDDPRRAETWFPRLFEATPIAIALLDGQGRIVRSNAAFARVMPDAAKPTDGAERGAIYAGVAARDRAALELALAAAAKARRDIAPVDVALAGEGDRSARLFISASEEGDGSGAAIFALDTTEQRALQSNFAQSQKMQAIGQLAGGVAHDFNNVLTAIIGFSDLLLANHRPTDPSFRDIMQIKQNAIRAAGLVRQLLAFSRRQTLRPQVLQLGDVLSELQMLMRRLVGEKIHLELRHGRDLWLIRADLNQFEQVIVNLIVNARDAMPDGGEILLKTRNVAPHECDGFEEKSLPAADYVAIEVEDCGHGVPPEVRDKIFEPFFTTKEVGKGTGLGLAMVYGIVKQTGGFVFCSSPPGKGATFTVLLPRYIPEAAETEAPAPAERGKPAADLTGRGVILLVEDEEAVRAFAARALASRGYSVLQAGSGIEALEVVDRNPGKIDLVVSDVVMPEMDGPTMFGELRKRGVKAKVIFVSGYAEEAFSKNLPEGEDFAFLPKPFSLKQLIEAVKGTAAAS
ncbi:multi-sensor hybrid histidine kinase [Methylocella silvestris BL2]|uniref:histidine kinase n=1 Tax=Methylocella silvestris (strain DSM 15510 / CIP 108128 / LMG 27833 / NCIMB 13906 / BL2) TaxID=395965 RepID=B8ETR4_METSB|nr:ATP-binding protein [Methylocella silvestris]ACK52416.1 multi-sensor hybrid histidine kinase [Methylocella silvestris BL2]